MKVPSVNGLPHTTKPAIRLPRVDPQQYMFIGLGVAFLTLLVILPLASMFHYASSKGLGMFWESISSPEALYSLSPNPPKDTDGRREDSGRGWVRELQGRWPGVLG